MGAVQSQLERKQLNFTKQRAEYASYPFYATDSASPTAAAVRADSGSHSDNSQDSELFRPLRRPQAVEEPDEGDGYETDGDSALTNAQRLELDTLKLGVWDTTSSARQDIANARYQGTVRSIIRSLIRAVRLIETYDMRLGAQHHQTVFDVLCVHSDLVLPTWLLQQLVQSAEYGALVIIVSNKGADAAQQTSALSDVIKTRCLHYMGTYTVAAQKNFDVFTYNGAARCNRILQARHIRGYFAAAGDPHLVGRQHVRRRTPLAITLSALPLYSINRLLIASERLAQDAERRLSLQQTFLLRYEAKAMNKVLDLHSMLQPAEHIKRHLINVTFVRTKNMDRRYSIVASVTSISNSGRPDPYKESLQLHLHTGRSFDIKWQVLLMGINFAKSPEHDAANDGHANIVVIDYEHQHLYRYEPHGQVRYKYLVRLDALLRAECREAGYMYHASHSTLPAQGPQDWDDDDYIVDVVQPPGGWCVAWCIWIAHVLLTKQSIADLNTAEEQAASRTSTAALGRSSYRPTSQAEFQALLDKMKTFIRPHRHWYSVLFETAQTNQNAVARTWFITSFATTMTKILSPGWDGYRRINLS